MKVKPNPPGYVVFITALSNSEFVALKVNVGAAGKDTTAT